MQFFSLDSWEPHLLILLFLWFCGHAQELIVLVLVKPIFLQDWGCAWLLGTRWLLILFYYLRPILLRKHKFKRGIALQGWAILWVSHFFWTLSLLSLHLLEYAWWQKLSEMCEKLISPLEFLLDLFLPVSRFVSFVGQIHVQIHALVLEPPKVNIVELWTFYKLSQFHVDFEQPIDLGALSLQVGYPVELELISHVDKGWKVHFSLIFHFFLFEVKFICHSAYKLLKGCVAIFQSFVL